MSRVVVARRRVYDDPMPIFDDRGERDRRDRRRDEERGELREGNFEQEVLDAIDAMECDNSLKRVLREAAMQYHHDRRRDETEEERKEREEREGTEDRRRDTRRRDARTSDCDPAKKVGDVAAQVGAGGSGRMNSRPDLLKAIEEETVRQHQGFKRVA
jgi:hypothetical protein